MKLLIRLLAMTICAVLSACTQKKTEQTNQIWVRLDSIQSIKVIATSKPLADNYQVYELQELLAEKLTNIPLDSTYLIQNLVQITLPFQGSDTSQFRVLPSGMVPQELALQFPDVRAFEAIGTFDHKLVASLIVFENKISAVISDGYHTEYINPVKDAGMFAVKFSLDESLGNSQIERRESETKQTATIAANPPINRIANAAVPIRTFRIAITATGEYTQRMGGSKSAAYAAITRSLTRINQIFTKEMGINFKLIENESALIFLDPLSDKLSNDDVNIMLKENQTIVDNIIKNENYDFAHVFSTAAGGVALQACVGKTGMKAQGVSGQLDPFGDLFDVTYVCHEIGHQFGASHIFNGPSCVERNAPTAVEPGSGSTIMGYAGVCGIIDNLQDQSDPYFNIKSLLEMESFLATCKCGTSQPGSNHNPAVTLAKNEYSIPMMTPFMLDATGTDLDNDSISYCWEQADIDTGEPCVPECQTIYSPNFRSYPPILVGKRYFPSYDDLLSYQIVKGEVYNTVTRSLNFIITVRDNKGGYSSKGCKVNVVNNVPRKTNDGPKKITPFSVKPFDQNKWVAGQPRTIEWIKAGTDNYPIKCKTVNIYLLLDGGKTFRLIADQTPNDGIEKLFIPKDISTSNARIMIQAVDNIFFCISDATFEIEPPNS